MLPSIAIILIAFIWLLIETDFMTIRLPYGKTSNKTLLLPEPIAEVKQSPILLIAEICERTRLQKEWSDLSSGTRYRNSDTWVYGTGYNTRRQTSYQSMTIGNQTVTLNATLPNLYELIAEVNKVVTEKPRKPTITKRDMVYTNSSDTRFNAYKEPLCGKDWLEAHYKDVIPEPTIELSIDGKTLSVNGNYKKGLIKEWVKANKGV